MNTKLKTVPINQKQYDSGEAFKKELELNLWCYLDKDLWLQVKPKKELPWNGNDMGNALEQILG